MNAPYHLIPIAIISISLYFLGLFLVQLNIFSQSIHRRIWNYLLLAVFLSTAILGLAIAIQINYKLEWPIVKTLLKFHVDFGIGLSFVALFHLLWHLSYYLKRSDFLNGKIQETQTGISVLPIQHTIRLAILSGFISTMIQVLMIRELTTVFEGNELMIGWILGIWMLLTGAGAYLGQHNRKFTNPKKLLTSLLLVLTIVPVVEIVLINILKNQLFPIGVAVNPTTFLVLLVVILSPICLSAGIIYTLLISQSTTSQNGYVKVYAFESIGSLAGGVIVSFLLIQWLSVIQSLLAISIVILITLYIINNQKPQLFYGFLLTILFIITFIYPIDTKIKSYLFTNQNVLKSKETIYGNLTVTESAGQYNFFGNGSLLFTTDNTILNEEYVHYAMLQKKNPENVLILSGGISGMIDEILKYRTVKKVDYLEINPSIVELASSYKPLPLDSRVFFHSTDGRRFISKTKTMYDIAIFAIPNPSSIQINRFYTQEFISILKQKLNSDAVIIFGLTPAGNYISPNKAIIEASIYQTLKREFKNVEVIPGERDYLLASNSELTNKIAEIATNDSIATSYVNPYYIDDYSIQQRSEKIKDKIKGLSLVNWDSKPLPVFYETVQFISQFKSNWILILPLLIILLPLFFMNNTHKGMYIAGYSASSIELLLIISFQVLFGYVYSAIGVIIAVFMGGLAIGSLLGNRVSISRKSLLMCQSLIALYSFAFPLLWIFNEEPASSLLVLLIFLLMTLIPAILVGFQYVTSTSIISKNVGLAASTMYSADLIGSALGVVSITLILLPLIGLIYSCIAIGAFNIVGVLLTSTRRESNFKQV